MSAVDRDRDVYLALLEERRRRWPAHTAFQAGATFLFELSEEEKIFGEAIGEAWRKLSDEERLSCGALYVCFNCGRRTKQEPMKIENKELPAYCSEPACIIAFADVEDRTMS